MNEPKEIAAEIATRYVSGGTWSEVETAIAAALQTKQDELERVKAACSHQWAPSEDSFECKLCGESDYGADRKVRLENITLKTEIDRVTAERDDAVKALEPFAEFIRGFSVSDGYENEDRVARAYSSAEQTIKIITVGHCRAARAVVEKVKQ